MGGHLAAATVLLKSSDRCSKRSSGSAEQQQCQQAGSSGQRWHCITWQPSHPSHILLCLQWFKWIASAFGQQR